MSGTNGRKKQKRKEKDEFFDQEFNIPEEEDGFDGDSLPCQHLFCDVINDFCAAAETCQNKKRLQCGVDELPSPIEDPLTVLIEQEEMQRYVSSHQGEDLDFVVEMFVFEKQQR